MRYLLIAAFLLSGCAGFDAYAPPPATCVEIDTERAEHNARVEGVARARAGKLAVAYGIGGAVAFGAVAPWLAVVPAILEAAKIDTSDNAERSRFLAHARLHLDCE